MITVEFDTKQFNQYLGVLVRQQLPFAASLALTKCAVRAQEEIRQQIQARMVVRRPWVLKGIRVTKADKRVPLDAMQSEVGSVDWFMVDQIADQKSVRSGDNPRFTFIPLQVRQSIFQSIPKSKSPMVLTKAAKKEGSNLFFQRSGNREYLFQRTRGGDIKPLYAVGPQQTIRPKINRTEVLNRNVQRFAQEEFVRAMEYAIKTAKPR